MSFQKFRKVSAFVQLLPHTIGKEVIITMKRPLYRYFGTPPHHFSVISPSFHFKRCKMTLQLTFLENI